MAKNENSDLPQSDGHVYRLFYRQLPVILTNDSISSHLFDCVNLPEWRRVSALP